MGGVQRIMEERFSKHLIKVAYSRRGISVIYSYGAFGVWGRAFRVGYRAFYFDTDADPTENLESYVLRHTDAEILDKIYEALNVDGFLSPEDKEYCWENLKKYENKTELRYFFDEGDKASPVGDRFPTDEDKDYCERALMSYNHADARKYYEDERKYYEDDDPDFPF